MPIERETVACPLCGGDGWTESSAELRRDGRVGDTTCVACNGTGWVHREKRSDEIAELRERLRDVNETLDRKRAEIAILREELEAVRLRLIDLENEIELTVGE